MTKVNKFIIIIIFLYSSTNILNAQDDVFKITNWNIAWLGCTSFGPTDENLQMNNAVAAMRTVNADIYCLQEITPNNTVSSINTIVALLGSDWGGNIVQFDDDDCDQNMGIVYRKSKVQFVNSSLINNGTDTYSYNWSGGRLPALYNVNLLTNSGIIPVSIVNIHAKAYPDTQSYTRRKGGSEALKVILDGNMYNTKNIIITGDYNDYLIGSMCSTCGDSPYKNFMDDSNNYSGITKDLTNAVYQYYGKPLIENIIISNELFDEYAGSIVQQETTLPQNINNYYNTTSDHLPVSAWLYFAQSAATDTYFTSNVLNIFPNPANSEIRIENLQFTDLQFTVLDLAGRQVLNGKLLNNNSIDVSTLSSGIYILKAGNFRGKFVKQ